MCGSIFREKAKENLKDFIEWYKKLLGDKVLLRVFAFQRRNLVNLSLLAVAG